MRTWLLRSAMLLKAQSLYSECSLACIAAYLLVALRQHNQPGQSFFPHMDCNAMCTLCTQLAGYRQPDNHLGTCLTNLAPCSQQASLCRQISTKLMPNFNQTDIRDLQTMSCWPPKAIPVVCPFFGLRGIEYGYHLHACIAGASISA